MLICCIMLAMYTMSCGVVAWLWFDDIVADEVVRCVDCGRPADQRCGDLCGLCHLIRRNRAAAGNLDARDFTTIVPGGPRVRTVLKTPQSIRENRALLRRIYDVPDEWVVDYAAMRLRRL